MILNIRQTNAPVGLCHHTGYIHWCAAFGKAQIDTIIWIGIHTGYLIISQVASQMLHFLRRVVAVRAQSKHQGYILTFNAGSVKMTQQGWHDLPGWARTCNIRGYNSNFFPWLHNLLQFRRTNRLRQSPLHLILTGEVIFHRVSRQHSHQIILWQLHCLYAFAKAKFQFHFALPPYC